jgi:hypothetical protein
VVDLSRSELQNTSFLRWLWGENLGLADVQFNRRTPALFFSSGAVSSLMVTPVTYTNTYLRAGQRHGIGIIDQGVNLVAAFGIG